MATGIAARIIAPYIDNKYIDPAVVTVDEGGRFAISLLSGHEGGANNLAIRVADFRGGDGKGHRAIGAGGFGGELPLDLHAPELPFLLG